jgi:hypothetical protein
MTTTDTTATEEIVVEPGATAAPAPGDRLRLVALSFLMLFLELALIRWSGSNNIHLAYLTNFVLLASFLGIGIGFMRVGKQPDLFRWAPVALAAFVVFVLAFPVTLASLGSGSLKGAFGMSALPRWASLSAIFILTVAVMACIGYGVARTFVKFPALEAYRLDILGSIGGIVLFSVFAFLELPPVGWGIVVSILLITLIGWRHPQTLLLGLVVVLLLIESLMPDDHWSPYYKVTARHSTNVVQGGIPISSKLKIWANNIPHQTAYPIWVLREQQPFYFFPYRHLGKNGPGRVLIVGAGSGNDVAVALHEGATHVDAVEIDPVIQSLGKKYHPDHPYSDPRVTVHIDDGRAFIENDHHKYNLILFALPDSLTLLAGQGALRLENYLFTLESMKTVKKHLAPGGTFAMYNYYEPDLLDRYASTLKDVYGYPPCAEKGTALGARYQAVLTTGAGASVNCRTPWHGRQLRAPTDDYPFPYLSHRAIPKFYWQTLSLMLIAALILVRVAGGRFRGMMRYTDLAFMGAAFLLLETKNIVQFALLFGTTWFVNALVFGGVLISVYLAVEVARHVKLPRPQMLYPLLIATIGLSWLIPQSKLLALSPVPRAAAAIALAFAPIFLANLIFAQRFRESETATMAFAANLLGAIVGGTLEYMALITGYRALLLLVALLYLCALAVMPRKSAALT